ncbi:reactive intermediate/imine deaminase [Shimia isoporae]|uniref:Reactive intermediate/imine deaminase n=1 Tax=Shimia isoporae TaxID=647720 RepID=A0A4R1N282_9RHOB|nr:RidA family protein [Shimia isoporae]TCL00308.1 reactive intermediate/imine deaminase [Shimia isoporae]
MTKIELIETEAAPAAGGHYSQAVRTNGQVWVSGVLPIPAKGLPDGADFGAQTERVLAHLDAVLTAAGASKKDVVQVRVYVTSISHWPAFDRAYAAFFGEHKPARAVVPVPELHYGYALELEAVAVCQT